MNLRDIRQAVMQRINYSTQEDSWHRNINRQISDAYQQIWMSKPWPFAQKQVDIPVFPDLLPSHFPSPGASASVINGSCLVDFDQDVLYPHNNAQVIEIEGIEYGIASIKANFRLYLDRPYQGVTDTNTLEWKIKNRYTLLPHDVAQVTSVWWTDAPIPGTIRRPTVEVTQRAFSQAMLSQQITGSRPTAYMMAPNTPIGAPWENLAPTLTLSTSTDNGALSPNSVLRFTYSYIQGTETDKYHDLLPESAPWAGNDANPDGYVEITIPPTGTYTVDLSCFLPDSRYGFKPYFAKIYNVNPMYDGRPLLTELRSVTELGPLISTTGSINIGSDAYTPATVDRAPNHGGINRRLQFYPRLDAYDKTVVIYDNDPYSNENLAYVTISYITSPQPLILDTDVPEIPPEFHQLIVDKVCMEQFLSLEKVSMYQLSQRQYDERWALMQEAYGSNTNLRVQKGMGQQYGTWNGQRPYLGGRIYPV